MLHQLIHITHTPKQTHRCSNPMQCDKTPINATHYSKIQFTHDGRYTLAAVTWHENEKKKSQSDESKTNGIKVCGQFSIERKKGVAKNVLVWNVLCVRITLQLIGPRAFFCVGRVFFFLVLLLSSSMSISFPWMNACTHTSPFQLQSLSRDNMCESFFLEYILSVHMMVGASA